MNSAMRLTNIKNVPFTANGVDLITGAEKYLSGLLELPLVEFVKSSFPVVSPIVFHRTQQVWEYAIAAFHLNQIKGKQADQLSCKLMSTAARIYEIEIQRILGALFPLEHPFWVTFYQRLEKEQEKPLLALDALYHCSKGHSKIHYQLLLQILKAILKARYLEMEQQRDHYQNALRLIGDLRLIAFQNWIKLQLNDLPNNSYTF